MIAEDIDELIGENPAQLREWFSCGEAVEPASLSGSLIRGEMLAFDVMKRAYGFSRPLFRGASKAFFWSWNGMVFEPSGERGTNQFLGRDFLGFACRVGDAVVDGKPCLKIFYDEAENAWFEGAHDEIRRISPHILVGCTIRRGAPWIWFGLQA